MTHSGIKISVGNKVTGVVPSKDSVVCETASGEKFSSSILLAAIGRKPVLPAKLELAGIVPEKGGFISVDSKCRTKVPGIYAIGDLTGRIQLAHLASAMGIVAAENACGNTCEFRDNLVPNCVFTSPELASVGLSEELCENRKLKYKTGKFPFAALGKAMAIDDSAGFCKIIADAETDQILGVHIVGPHATDLIAEAVAAMNLECTATEMDRIIHAHPTLPEAIMEAAHDLHGKSIHIPSKKK
jgi:dihydrolipoamide dehydrogenase